MLSAAKGKAEPLPDWALPRRTYLTSLMHMTAAAMQGLGVRIVKKADFFMGIRPKESLYRLPRLLTVHHHRPQVMDNCFIAPSALLTGDVRVGRKNYIGYNAILRAEEGQTIHLGESCNVQEKAILTGNCTVGKWSTIEPMAIVESADIASCSWVGANAIVMRGAKIESGAMLCAAAVLQAGATIPSGEMWAGNPAEKIGVLTEKEKNSIITAAKHQVLLGVEHHDSWQLTWEELENIREARELYAQVTEHNVEIRAKPFYIKEPPRPSRKPQQHHTSYELHEGENKPPLMESIHQGY